ncbi:Trigger factor [Anoxybacillus sp. BCO1]|nr:Trigger factor [Anoxybacillus sp. BCO1]
MLREFEQRLQMQGLNLDLYYQFSGQDEAALRQQMKEEAEKRVRVTLTLEAIVKAENIDVTEEEVEKELEEMANLYSLSVDKLKELLGTLDGLKEDLKMRKAIDFLVENSKVVA